MAIEFDCPHCAQLLRVDDVSAGKTAKCPKCSGLSRIPRQTGAEGAEGIGPPPESMPPANPFSDPGAAAPGEPTKPGSLVPAEASNPYQSPAAVAYPTYKPPYTPGEVSRTGLPWETHGHSLGTWWETMTMILSGSSDAFRRMRVTGGFVEPMIYAMIGMAVGAIGQFVLRLGFLALSEDGDRMQFQLAYATGAAILQPLLGASLGCLIQAGILHFGLRLVGAETKGFEATYRVCAYCAGVFGAFAAIPIIGPCIGWIWHIIVLITGLAEAHETTGGKAAAAFFITIGLLVALAVMVSFLLVGAAMHRVP